MARLSFGSHHFQAQSNRKALQIDNAQRVVNHSREPSHEPVEDEPPQDKETSAPKSFELNLPKRRDSDNESAKSEYISMKSQINLLTKSNSDLLSKIAALKDENECLKDALTLLRGQLESLQKPELVDDLESAVLSTFAKILDKVQRLKNNHDSIVDEHKRLEITSSDETDDLINKAQTKERERIPTKPAPPAVERKLDYLELTFFKPADRKGHSIKRKPFVVKSENVEDSQTDTISSNKVKPARQAIQGDKLYGTDYEAYLDEVPSPNAEPTNGGSNTGITSSSTPRKKSKKRVMLDIYGDEIHVNKKGRNSSQLSSPKNKEITASQEEATDSMRGKKRVLANITNRKKSIRTKERPLVQEPVDKSIFEYVDENVLMEQTQNLVRTIRDKLR